MRAVKRIIALVVMLPLLGGCSSGTESLHTSEALSGVSEAAAVLASRVDETDGLIAGKNSDRGTASDHAYIYDNAVALIALSRAGADRQAQAIADAMVFAQGHDRTFSDGRLRNAYLSGNPQSDAGRSIVGGKVSVNLPGFWQDGRWQEDQYTVSTSAGNMAWVILALCEAAGNAGEEKRTAYLSAAEQAADFILSLKSPDGGFVAGCEGWDDQQKKLSYKSTEHNIAIACAFRALSAATEEDDPDRAKAYRDTAKYARDFVFSMYDARLHCFYTGTTDDGETVSDGVIPLDANALAILAFGDELEDAHAVLSFVEDQMTVGRGYDFSAGDLDGIWNEGTAQMAVCCWSLESTQKYEDLIQYLLTQVTADGMLPAADRDGVSTGFALPGTDRMWEYNNEPSVSATAWAALAQIKTNPFR